MAGFVCTFLSNIECLYHVSLHLIFPVKAQSNSVQSILSDVWLVGDSYVHWLQKRAELRSVDQSLGNKHVTKVEWIAKRGMHWSELNNRLQYCCLYKKPPRFIIIHLGSNDLTTVKGCELEHSMRKDMGYWMEKLPNTIFVFSELLPRLNWSAPQFPPSKINKKRKHLNNCLRCFVCFNGGKYLCHPDIETETPGLYFRDGIHLSDVGYDFMLLRITDLLNEYGAEFWGEQVRVAENSADDKV